MNLNWTTVAFEMPSSETIFICYILITYILAAFVIRNNNRWFCENFDGNENPPVFVVWMCSPVWLIPYWISNFLTKR